ncbi:alpha/beta fold hydrolase [Aegicerativicinus sediminis]
MKHVLLQIFLFFTLLNLSFGQDINYGSNQGKYISISNTKIYYEEYGSGMPLLLLHGGFGSIHDFQEVIPEFAKHYRVIAIDSPGHGKSELPDSLSFDLMVDVCSQLIDAFKLDSLNVMGYSDGGITALLLAAKRPEKVRKIIATGVNSRMDAIKPEVLETLRMISPEFMETYQKEWIADYNRKSSTKDQWKKYINSMREMYFSDEVVIPSQVFSDIKAKVLLVFGDNDVVKLEHGIELFHSINGSELCVLPDTPHEIFKSSPKLMSEIGLEFLQK